MVELVALRRVSAASAAQLFAASVRPGSPRPPARRGRGCRSATTATGVEFVKSTIPIFSFVVDEITGRAILRLVPNQSSAAQISA